MHGICLAKRLPFDPSSHSATQSSSHRYIQSNASRDEIANWQRRGFEFLHCIRIGKLGRLKRYSQYRGNRAPSSLPIPISHTEDTSCFCCSVWMQFYSICKLVSFIDEIRKRLSGSIPRELNRTDTTGDRNRQRLNRQMMRRGRLCDFLCSRTATEEGDDMQIMWSNPVPLRQSADDGGGCCDQCKRESETQAFIQVLTKSLQCEIT